MIRLMAIVVALVAGSAAADEPMDCFNDETDVDTRYTRTEPEVLRVTDADIAEMLTRVRENESRSVASGERDSALRLSLSSNTPASE